MPSAKTCRIYAAEGRCIGCGRARDSEKMVCNICVGNRRSCARRAYSQCVIAGLCVKCHNRKARANKSFCGQCAKALSRVRKLRRIRTATTPKDIRNRFCRGIRAKFGLSLERFDEMLVEQNGRCAICGSPFLNSPYDPAVDHDHKTGLVRGLLHHICNLRLEAIELQGFVEAAQKYLTHSVRLAIVQDSSEHPT